MELNTRVFLEPRGFIRVIQFVMAIFAFATTSGFSTDCKFLAKYEGPEGDEECAIDYTVGYSFSRFVISAPKNCTEQDKIVDTVLPYDFASSPRFFVATGVLSFLYTIGISGLYAFASSVYESNQAVPIVDLGISGVLAIFWLSGASAWAQGVSDLKTYLAVSQFGKKIPLCSKYTCTELKACRYATLNVSLIFGFANFALWAASLWFVFKETIFHTRPQIPPGQPPQTFPQQQYPPQQYPPQQYSPTETKMGGQI